MSKNLPTGIGGTIALIFLLVLPGGTKILMFS